MANLQKIKELARQKNLTLREVAANAGITQQALSKIIRVNSATIDTAEKIAAALEVSPAEFFKETDCSTHVSNSDNNTDNTNEPVDASYTELLNAHTTLIKQYTDTVSKFQQQNQQFLNIIERLTNAQ